MTDRDIVRELAARYAEAANDPVNAERMQRGYDTNGLKPVRPLVWIEEVPWHEMNIGDELTLKCQSEECRAMELFFRQKLYQWKYFQADMVLDPYYAAHMVIHSTGNGLEINQSMAIADKNNNIQSHAYKDQLDTMEKLEVLHPPVLTRDRETEDKQLSFLHDMLDGVLPVRLVGNCGWYWAWDDVSRYRGMGALLMDLLAEPELMHATIQKFVEIYTATVDQVEKLGAYSSWVPMLHNTPGYSRELEQIEREEGNTARCTWFRAAAQPLGQVSPALFDEFEIEYLLPLASRFGLTYYGCCESLYDRIDLLKKIPNLRKVGVTPWSKIVPSAEQLGGDFVFASKPNPALLMRNLDEDGVRKEIRETAEACVRYGCPCEFALTAISTLSYRPQNLFRWVQIVEETIDRYY